MAQTPEKTPDDALADLAEQIVAVDPDAVISHEIAFGELSLTVTAGRIVGLVKRLRDHPALLFTTLVDICAVDHPGREKRFDVVYHFLSMRQNHRVRLRAPIREDETIPSVTPLFPAANWFERETFDMHGVIFTGHPDLRRLLTDYGFQGFPLRKDFPTTGYTEVRYDEAAKRVIYEPVSLVQEYRRFDFMSPWEGAEYILPGDEKTSAG